MITKISFEGYKGFRNLNELEIKPITILLGKNSSGKSSIAKLPVIIEESISGNGSSPILHSYKGIELGAEFRDLLYNRNIQGELFLEFENDLNEKISVNINNSPLNNSPIISKWKYSKNGNELESYNLISSETKIKFEGILPKDLKQNLLKDFAFETNYIGPFRLNPPRIFHLNGEQEFKRIGNKGEHAYQILANSLENKDGLLENVGEWYRQNFDGWKLIVKKNSPYYEIHIVRDDNDEGVNIVDVGQGMSQALPIVVKAYMKSQSSLIIIEQPELHLHPAAHGNLADLIATTQKDSGNRFLIETHSENFILRLRRMVAEKRLNNNELAIYSVEYDPENQFSFLKKITVDTEGEVDYWPEDIFKESLVEVKALRAAQNK